MKRPDHLIPRRFCDGRFRRPARPGYTLVEILTATVLMLIIMMAVTVIFANVTDSIGQSRATLEMNQRLRASVAVVKQDLDNATAVMNPPLHPRANQGYLQYVEGPIGPVVPPSAVAWNYDANLPDSTVGDIDDILMFTATSKGAPYVGLIDGSPSVSNSAEIIYFIRGTTLYRRVLLIKPEVNVREVNRRGFYARYDLSVRKVWDDKTVPPGDPTGQHRPVLKANSLADLTQPECRFAHCPDLRSWGPPQYTPTGGVPAPASPKFDRGSPTNNPLNLRYWREGKPYPFFSRPWLGSPYSAELNSYDPGSSTDYRWVPGLGLPILAECSDRGWVAGDPLPSDRPSLGAWTNPANLWMPQCSPMVDPGGYYDAWTNPHPWSNVDSVTGVMLEYDDPYRPAASRRQKFNGSRLGEDVLMTNVIGFDVKAWDPDAAVFTQDIENPPGTTVDQVVIMPGDPGYVRTVRRLQNHILTNTVPSSGLNATFGAFVDLNYMANVPLTATVVYPDNPYMQGGIVVLPVPQFHREGNWRSLAYGTRWEFGASQQPYEFYPSVYDTWSLHYEANRQTVYYFSENPADANQQEVTVGNEDRNTDTSGNPLYDEGTNGLDDDNQNGVDDVGERETQPPYAAPLQGIQIRIRAFEPSSRQVREVTIVHKFRTK